jgi:uncharacterized membrane protein YfcA
MPVELSIAEATFVLTMVGLGALIQGSLGFGFAFAVAPALALIRPEAVPATIVLHSIPMVVLMAIRERGSIRVRDFLWITAGRLPGTLVGAWILLALPAGSLGAAFGLLILAGVIMSAAGPNFGAGNRAQFLGGVASGIMGTAAGIGSPPLALVNQNRPGAQLRSTLAISFIVGTLISLAALFRVGMVREWHVLFALELVPALLLGLLASNFAIPLLDRKWLRPALLTFAGCAAVITILRSYLGGGSA